MDPVEVFTAATGDADEKNSCNDGDTTGSAPSLLLANSTDEGVLDKTSFVSILSNYNKSVAAAFICHKNHIANDRFKTPYIAVCLGRVQNALIVGGIESATIISACLLKDVLSAGSEISSDQLSALIGNQQVVDIVLELTDNSALSKKQQRLNRIEMASKWSDEAKTIEMCSMLYNIKTMMINPPDSYKSAKVVQGHITWCRLIFSKMRGTDSKLEIALDEIFGASFKFKDNETAYPCCPKSIQRAYIYDLW